MKIFSTTFNILLFSEQYVGNDDSLSKIHNPAFDADHTVLAGVVIDWGHGWGWGHVPWAAGAASCSHDVGGINSLYCQEDYTLGGGGGYDEVDWAAFGDFTF